MAMLQKGHQLHQLGNLEKLVDLISPEPGIYHSERANEKGGFIPLSRFSPDYEAGPRQCP